MFWFGLLDGEGEGEGEGNGRDEERVRVTCVYVVVDLKGKEKLCPKWSLGEHLLLFFKKFINYMYIRMYTAYSNTTLTSIYLSIYLRPMRRRAHRRAISRKQEIAGDNFPIGLSLSLHELDVDALERAIRPSRASVPRVSALFLRRAQRDLNRVGCALLVACGDVVAQCRDGGLRVEADVRVIVCRVTQHDEVAGLRVVGEALGGVAKCDAVCDVVVCGSLVACVAAP